MPNWKKVITSGSDAALNGLIVTNNLRINASGSSIISGSFVVTGSSQIIGPISVTGDQTITGNILITGNITAQQYIISSSVYYVTQSFSSGSSVFGNSLDDTHQFTGSLYVTGSVIATNGFTGSLQGTASLSQNAVTASFLPIATYQITASVANNAVTASYITGSVFTSANPALSASFALTASHALNISPPVTINNNTDNFIVTATGTSLTVQGEPNFRFNGTLLQLTGSAIISGTNASLIVSGTVSATNGFTGNLTGTSSWADSARQVRMGVFGTLPNGEGETVYYLPVTRNFPVGTTVATLLAQTSSLVYSASLDLLLVTASWAGTSSYAIIANYALAAPGTTPQGNTNEIQYNVDGTNFGGVPTLTYNGSELVGTGRFDGNLRLGLFRGTYVNVPAIASKGNEVLVYSQYIPAGTFTDDDVIRVRYKIQNSSNDTALFRIYLDDQSDFSIVSGSLTKLIAESRITQSVKYVGMKRDLVLDTSNSRLVFMNSGSSVIDSTTDDLVSNEPVSTYTMDWNNTDYWMFFSAKPGQVGHSSRALGFTIERV